MAHWELKAMLKNKRIIGVALFGLLASLSRAHADDSFEPGELELAPIGSDIECSWSKMNSKEYGDCQKKREFFKKMPLEKRREWNEAVEKRILERRMRRLERRIN